MINPLSLFEQTQLAEAAYASFGEDITDRNKLQDALKTIDFSQTQAEEFLKRWKVIDQYATGGTADDSSFDWFGSGFSATLFERVNRMSAKHGLSCVI